MQNYNIDETKIPGDIKESINKMVNKIEKIDSIETYNDLKGMANLLNSFSESDSDNNLVDKKDKPVKKMNQ